jgi:two-component system, chemotaxis family, CheB/CheR fusion protein
LGIRAIKGEGGVVVAQDPDSTEYDGMPRNAIATGLVDYVLPPAEMPAQIIAYVTRAFGRPRQPVVASPQPEAKKALNRVFILLRNQTGHDFSQYKPSTIHRRIERRMAIQQVATLDEYVKVLQHFPAEVDALFRDMLIGVTSFFRDPEAFAALEEMVIPKLFAENPVDGVIRLWSPACATGEEAYSLAILLAEHLETQRQHPKIQIFATDIDSQAIATARAGLYPASITVDVSAERLARFFVAEPDGNDNGASGYRICKRIRDMIIFSEQNVIKDPPFSKLDLINCRNLLIYLSGELQKRLIPLFHYALNPGGFLFLGTSETVGESRDLFTVVDRKSKLYRREAASLGAPRVMLSNYAPQRGRRIPVPIATKAVEIEELPLSELTEIALLNHIPAAVLVNDRGDILYIHGRTGRYLEPPPGEAGVNNILTMAREGLRRPLTIAMHKATLNQCVVRVPNLRVKTNGDFAGVDMTIRPVAADAAADRAAADRAATDRASSLYLVILEQVDDQQAILPAASTVVESSAGTESDTDAESGADARIHALQQELQAKEEYLQTTTEELKTSNEELRSSNEELQSVNEELQSTNEELETSKEELQSVNEELATVNAELQTKVGDLTQANNDMNNLLAGTGIATVFVDHQLRIMRFTPTATKIINLIQSDIGRPVGHIASNLVNYDDLLVDTQAVLDTLIPKELEVQTKTGAWYTMRIQPYRTLHNVIEGAVITFTDISRAKALQEALHSAVQRLIEAFVPTIHKPLLALDKELRVIAATPSFYNTFGLTETATQGQRLYELNNQWDSPALHRLLEEQLPQQPTINDFEITYDSETLGRRTLSLTAQRITHQGDPSELILLTITDITDPHQRPASGQKQ